MPGNILWFYLIRACVLAWEPVTYQVVGICGQLAIPCQERGGVHAALLIHHGRDPSQGRRLRHKCIWRSQGAGKALRWESEQSVKYVSGESMCATSHSGQQFVKALVLQDDLPTSHLFLVCAVSYGGAMARQSGLGLLSYITVCPTGKT